jgi:hypothetical protein
MSIIPAGAGNTLGRTARGRWFIASNIRTDLPQQVGNATSKAPEDPRRRRNWQVFLCEPRPDRNSEFIKKKVDSSFIAGIIRFLVLLTGE